MSFVMISSAICIFKMWWSWSYHDSQFLNVLVSRVWFIWKLKKNCRVPKIIWRYLKDVFRISVYLVKCVLGRSPSRRAEGTVLFSIAMRGRYRGLRCQVVNLTAWGRAGESLARVSNMARGVHCCSVCYSFRPNGVSTLGRTCRSVATTVSQLKICEFFRRDFQKFWSAATFYECNDDTTALQWPV